MVKRIKKALYGFYNYFGYPHRCLTYALFTEILLYLQLLQPKLKIVMYVGKLVTSNDFVILRVVCSNNVSLLSFLNHKIVKLCV